VRDMSISNKTIVIDHKDPDMEHKLHQAGVDPKAVEKIIFNATWGEYFNIELTFNEDGTFTGRFV
jgi:hypothetical protein